MSAQPPGRDDTHLKGTQERKPSSYAQIFKSSALIGGTSLLTVAVGVVRTKLMAMILGPEGVGLMGALGAIADLTRSIAGMGINRSGVRQIAEAVGSGDQRRIATTVTVLRRTAVGLGAIGAAMLLVLAVPVANLTFGDHQHTAAVMLLAAAVFFTLVADGQAALLQGMRRIRELAKIGVICALGGTLAALPIVYWLGQNGVSVALGAIAALSALVTWHYSRQVSIEHTPLNIAEWQRECGALLRLGIAFMASGFLAMGAAYAVRIFVLNKTGLGGAGYFQAAWTVGGLYVGFVLQAMGTDFYPRLVSQCHDHEASNRLVNEQAEISMLIAGPGVLATLVLAPLLTTVFYTPEFVEAVEVLRWICVGMALRVFTWPMGYIIVAKNKQLLFIGAELAWTIVNISLSWVLVQRFGLTGAGIAFALSYVFHAFLVYPIARSLTGFRWLRASGRVALWFLVMIVVVMCSFQFLPSRWAMTLGLLTLICSLFYSLRTITALVGFERMSKVVTRWVSRSGPRTDE